MSSSDRTARRREIEDSTAARLAEIVAAAEQAAKQVIDEAEADARARLVDARAEADRIVAERLTGLAELTDEISAQAEALRRHSETLQRALAEAKAELGGAESLDGPPSPGRRASDWDREPEPERERAPEPGPAPESRSQPEIGRDPERGSDPDPDPEEDTSRPAGPALTVVGSNGERKADGEPAESSSPAGARLLATQMAVSGSSRAEIEARLRDGFAITDTGGILDAILGPEN